jgi:hypothetical protein
MRELTEWWDEIRGDERSWLILGKGPSLARLPEFDVSSYARIALNHVVREQAVDVASAIDLDVVRDCGESIRQNARYLLMPRYPHVNFVATERNLESFFEEVPVLRTLSDEGRLVWYNLGTGQRVPGSPLIPNGVFSAEVIVKLLAIMGATTIRSLGVDGGTAYAAPFEDLENKTRLAAGHGTFDAQFQGISFAIDEYGLDYGPLTSEIPLRVFIGTDETQSLAARVLEYSIKRHCAITGTYDTMLEVKVPTPKERRNQPQTGFSFNRFAIPKLAGYQGRAIYVDADMLVLRNITELWDLPFGGAKVLYALSPNPKWPSQFSVMLLDCSRLDWDVEQIIRDMDAGMYDYNDLLKKLCIVPEAQIRSGIPPEWNSLELYEPGKTGLLHYTEVGRQPWVSKRNPNGDLWVWYLREAVRSGFIPRSEVRQAVKEGYVRPSLFWQLLLPRPLWGIFQKTVARGLDLRFKPHRALIQRLKPA